MSLMLTSRLGVIDVVFHQREQIGAAGENFGVCPMVRRAA